MKGGLTNLSRISHSLQFKSHSWTEQQFSIEGKESIGSLEISDSCT